MYGDGGQAARSRGICKSGERACARHGIDDAETRSGSVQHDESRRPGNRHDPVGLVPDTDRRHHCATGDHLNLVVGEVRGLEICRVVDDAHTGAVRLEVGMGANDREAFALVHGDVPTADALANVVAAVRPHRADDAPLHPLNMFGAERLMRARAIENPSMVNCVSVVAAEPPVARTNLKDAVPCVAIGEESDGTRRILVFVNGVDLDAVSFALDAWHRLDRTAHVTVVLREKDKVASIDRLARLGIVPVEVLALKG
ncbi:MAG: hypothetical protein RLZ84_432 [Actinomycetota bacterium]